MSDPTTTAPLTADERAAIARRADAATPGPWRTWPDGTEESVESESVGRFICHLNSNMRQFREDALFIAHAREDIPRLLAALDAAEHARDEDGLPWESDLLVALGEPVDGDADDRQQAILHAVARLLAELVAERLARERAERWSALWKRTATNKRGALRSLVDNYMLLRGKRDQLRSERDALAREVGALREADRRQRSLLDSAAYELEWLFDHVAEDGGKDWLSKYSKLAFFECNCSDDGGYMEWDTNAYIHTERCASEHELSLSATLDQIRAALAGGRPDEGGEGAS